MQKRKGRARVIKGNEVIFIELSTQVNATLLLSILRSKLLGEAIPTNLFLLGDTRKRVCQLSDIGAIKFLIPFYKWCLFGWVGGINVQFRNN